MKKYQVEIEREVLNDTYVIQRLTAEIKAENAQEAEERAQVLGYDLEGKGKWRVIREDKTHDVEVLPDGVKIKSIVEIV